MSKTTITYRDIPPGADEVAVFKSGSATDFSDLDLLRHENEQHDIITLEQNGWPLDGRKKFYNGEIVPFWSEEMSGPDGVFNNPPVIEITFPDQHSSVGMTFVFEDIPGGFCSDLNIKWYQRDSIVSEGDFEPNANEYFCLKKAVAWDKIVITFRKTFLPYRYVKLRQIIFGVIRRYGMDEIRSAKITNQTNLISADIPICTLNWVLDSREDVDFMFQFKQTVEVVNDDFLLGVFYIDETRRTSKSVYNIRCEDAFGVLDDTEFPAGVYSGYSAKRLFSEIVDGDFEIYYDDEVDDFQLTGVLQPMARRAALQQILFAWGVCAATDGTDGIRVFKPYDNPIEISADRSYTGVSVTTTSIVTSVQVTAHKYTEDEYGSIEVNGKKYRDDQTVYTVTNSDVTANDKQNVKKVEAANFITNEIGQATAQRVYDYYLKRNTAKSKIVWRGELLGDCVTLPTTWDSVNTGNISALDITLSNTVAASAEVIAP